MDRINVFNQFDDSRILWDEQKWKKACLAWNQHPRIESNSLTHRGRTITSRDIIALDIFMARSIYPIQKGALKMGIGVPDRNGGFIREKPHWICRDDGVTLTHEPSAVIPRISRMLNNIQVTLRARERRLIIGSHGVPFMEVYCRGLEKTFKDHIEVIAFISTPYGNVNLIPEKGASSLETLAARAACKRLEDSLDIDLLDIPRTCQEILRKMWIRTHAVILIPDSLPI